MKGKEGEGKLLRLLSLSLSPDKPTSADLFPFLREREGGQFGEEAFHSPSPLSQATTISPTLASAAIIEEKRKGACEESCEKVPPAHSAFFLSGSEWCELSVFVSYDTWIPAFPYSTNQALTDSSVLATSFSAKTGSSKSGWYHPCPS